MRLLVLDIDGVMVDAAASFAQAVAGALAELRPGLAWSDAHFAAFKRVGGFNNDFRLCAGALALADAGGLDAISAAQLGPLEASIEALEPLATAAVRRAYVSTSKLERPLISEAELRGVTGFDRCAILTGRPPLELAQAFAVLGFRLRAVPDSAPHLRKPHPWGLLWLAQEFGARAVTFVGDTVDDARCLERARALRPEIAWTFAAVGPTREEIPADARAESLRALLADLRVAAPR